MQCGRRCMHWCSDRLSSRGRERWKEKEKGKGTERERDGENDTTIAMTTAISSLLFCLLFFPTFLETTDDGKRGESCFCHHSWWERIFCSMVNDAKRATGSSSVCDRVDVCKLKKMKFEKKCSPLDYISTSIKGGSVEMKFLWKKTLRDEKKRREKKVDKHRKLLFHLDKPVADMFNCQTRKSMGKERVFDDFLTMRWRTQKR